MTVGDPASSECVASISLAWILNDFVRKGQTSSVWHLQKFKFGSRAERVTSLPQCKTKTKKGEGTPLWKTEAQNLVLLCKFQFGSKREQRVSNLCTPYRKTPTPNSVVVSKYVATPVHWSLLLVGSGVNTPLWGPRRHHAWTDHSLIHNPPANTQVLSFLLSFLVFLHFIVVHAESFHTVALWYKFTVVCHCCDLDFCLWWKRLSCFSILHLISIIIF